MNLYIPTINVGPNTPIGQPIGSTSGYAFNSGVAMRCTYNDWPFYKTSSSVLSIVNSSFTGMTFSASGLSLPVYATNVPGVGFAMMARDPNQPLRAINHNGATLLTEKNNKPGSWGLMGTVFLVATGPVSGGTISARNIARLIITNANIGGAGYHAVNFSNTVINPPRKPTCSVSTTALALPLGRVAINLFNGIGSVAGAASNDLIINCAGATGGATSDVLITLTDQTQPNNRSNVLSLTPASTVGGVGLQLSSGGRLVSYGADSSAVGNPNQWLAGNMGNGVLRIPLTARYIQTGVSITPGTANGVATFTMSYR
ncbi:fimbrial protein [Pseudomonas karstica]|uniref:fimbrial protein n=1 Tax=Pseudomonas karstica TaxID=1055468 RepID=UPI0015B4BD1D|nr:fimbrial protein [Pseudomonas karstica]